MTSKTENKVALITGASSGIGRALAYEFAANGYDLLLVALEREALEAVADECEKLHGVNVETHVFDLSDLNAVREFAATLSGKRVDVLANNAGFAVHGAFAETPVEREIKMVDLQLSTMLQLTKTVLPQMIERRNGRILNVASVYSFSPVKKQAVYSASKAFIFSFSTALRSELKDTGVTVTVIAPGVVKTAFRTSAGIEDKGSGMTADSVAKLAYDETMRGTHLVIPGFVNKLFVFFSRHLPFGMQTALINFINKKRGVNK